MVPSIAAWDRSRPRTWPPCASASPPLQGSAAGFDLVVWAGLEPAAGEVDSLLPAYQDAGVTWEAGSARPQPPWWQRAQRCVSSGSVRIGTGGRLPYEIRRSARPSGV
jgi:hypothetical protein